MGRGPRGLCWHLLWAGDHICWEARSRVTLGRLLKEGSVWSGLWRENGKRLEGSGWREGQGDSARAGGAVSPGP